MYIFNKTIEGDKKAKKIKKMLKEPSKFLATIQIGITLAGFLSSAFASEAFADMLAPALNNLILNNHGWREGEEETDCGIMWCELNEAIRNIKEGMKQG